MTVKSKITKLSKLFILFCFCILVLNITSCTKKIGVSEENKSIMENFAREINKGNIEYMNKVLHPDFVNHNPAPGYAPNKKGYIKAVRDISEKITAPEKGLPGYQVIIEDMIAEKDKVSLRLTGVGIHSGTVGKLPPTNKRFKWQAFAFFRIKDGMIIERWEIGNLSKRLKELSKDKQE